MTTQYYLSINDKTSAQFRMVLNKHSVGHSPVYSVSGVCVPVTTMGVICRLSNHMVVIRKFRGKVTRMTELMI